MLPAFDDTYGNLMERTIPLMERTIPLDEDIQSALGVAVESFPRLLPQVFNIYIEEQERECLLVKLKRDGRA